MNLLALRRGSAVVVHGGQVNVFRPPSPTEPPRCPRPPRPPRCDFAMSLLVDDVELGQTT